MATLYWKVIPHTFSLLYMPLTGDARTSFTRKTPITIAPNVRRAQLFYGHIRPIPRQLSEESKFKSAQTGPK
jgi:hypothetical protein